MNGQLSESNKMEALLTALDQRAFILTSEHPQELATAVRSAKKWLDAYVFDKEVHVYVRNPDRSLNQSTIMQILLDAGITIDTLQTSHPTLKNAYREVLAGHVI